MNSSSVPTSTQYVDSTAHAQERLRDSSHSQRQAVDTVSDKASKQASEVGHDSKNYQRSPSAVYVRSETSYESSYSSSIRTAKSDAVSHPDSSDVASGSILSFIDRQLQQDHADGASQEDLKSRIEAGLSGFLKGFEEASEDLEALGLLTPELKADIQQTYDKVLAGVDELKAKYLGETSAAPRAESSEVVSPEVEDIQSPASLLQGSSQYSSYEASQKNSFSFTVVTQDGDNVTIKSSGLQAMMQERFSYSGASGDVEQSQFAYSQESSFEFQVDGDLDSGEMKALTELLSQVNDLAESFFSGDIGGAFNAALNLGYDDSEISTFALNLSQTSIQKATTAYQGDNAGPSSLAETLRPVGNFARDLLEASRSAEVFQRPQELIGSIAGGIESARSEDGFKSFLERLLESFDKG